MTSSTGALLREPRFRITRYRRICLSITGILVFLSLLGLFLSWLSPLHSPLKPGLDFTGGTSIQVERRCEPKCADLNVDAIRKALVEPAVVQLLDDGRAISLRTAALSPAGGPKLLKCWADLVGSAAGEAADVPMPINEKFSSVQGKAGTWSKHRSIMRWRLSCAPRPLCPKRSSARQMAEVTTVWRASSAAMRARKSAYPPRMK
jgi:preprotein translocase subunit SecF